MLAQFFLHLQLFICEVFPQLVCHSLQVLEADLASLVVVEEFEGLDNKGNNMISRKKDLETFNLVQNS